MVWRQRILLHWHAKLAMWLPPGGHIESDELPDDAAVREVHEETGVFVRLVGERGLDIAAPRQLTRPEGIQVEDIAPGHQHIDLVYFAVPLDDATAESRLTADRTDWYGREELDRVGVNAEIHQWCERALVRVPIYVGRTPTIR